jgi:hypothetical protein
VPDLNAIHVVEEEDDNGPKFNIFEMLNELENESFNNLNDLNRDEIRKCRILF